MKELTAYWTKLGRRTRRIVLICGALFAVYLVGGFFVAGPVLRTVTENNLSALLQRNATVGKVRVNPVTFGVVVEDLAIAKKDGDGNMASFKRLDVRLHPLSVFKFAPVLAHLNLVQPSVEIAFLGDGQFSISDLIPASGSTNGTEEEDSSVFPFRVDNLLITNGTVTFHDLPHKATHVVSQLDFAVPLTSSLGGDAEEYVEPSLKALVNGEPVELFGKTKPFDKTMVTEFTFETAGIDLARYWEYVPGNIPLRLASGSVATKVLLTFSRPEEQTMQMKVSGQLTLSNVAVATPDMKDAAGFSSLSVDVEEFSLFDQTVTLRDVTLAGPYVKAVRNADGVLNWQSYFAGDKPIGKSVGKAPAKKNAAGNAVSATKGAKKDVTKGKSVQAVTNNGTQAASAAAPKKKALVLPFAPYVIEAKQIAIRDGRVSWKDDTVGFSRQVTPINLTLTNLSSRKNAKTGISLKIGDKEYLSVKGSASLVPLKAALDVGVGGVELPVYAAYLESFQPLKIDGGTLEAALHALVSMDGNEPVVQLEGMAAALSGLAMRKDGNRTPSIELESLQVQGGRLDLAARNVTVDLVKLTGPEVRLIRYKDGLDLVNLFAGGETGRPASGDEIATHGRDSQPWTAALGEFSIENGKLRFVDRTLSNRGGVVVSNMELTVRDASTDLGKPVPVSYSAYIGGGGRNNRIKPGRVRVDGTVRPDPFDMQVRVRHDNVPLAVLDPYVGEYTGMLLAGGVLNTDMQKHVRLQAQAPEGAEGLAAEPLQVVSKGSLRIDGLSLKDVADSSPVASFDRFSVQNFDISTSDSKLYVEEIALDNLQANALVDKDGVFNFARLMHPSASAVPSDRRGRNGQEGAAGAVNKGGAAETTVAGSSAPDSPVTDTPVTDTPLADTPATNVTDAAGSSAVVPSTSAETTPANTADTPAAAAPTAAAPADTAEAGYASVLPFRDVRIDRVRVNNGALRFTDRSVAPAFVTALTELNARLDGISLAPDARPALDITAKLDNQTLALKGVANPIISPMYSDVTFTLNGVDLVPLSPYSLRSVAYPIEKGRLYADVKVKTENWILSANNKLFLEQLVMGDKDKRPDAPSIPIKLGLALLSDSSGNVEIDLPIKGRLDDPHFLTGGIVFKAFVNLIFKVVTSPFALIGNIVGGGGDDAQFSVFEAGSDRLTEGQLQNLKGVVDFMNKKSSLKLEISGFVDPQADAAGLVELSVRRRVQAAKYADMSRRERAAVAVEDVQVTPEEYAEYLTDAYKDVPEMENDPRPAGVFGFKEVPVADMEAFLRSLTTVTPQTLTELAAARAKAVQAAVLQLDPALAPRVFLTGAGKKPTKKTGVPLHRAELGVR
ncbi:DUF748 domain-containing protein [Desulfovibrio subterraneus]|uniref:DUF748 domain-containing protein n=1 Tax=Desulfovibrio subterraneus TaxID=2718620 RepID=UPI0022B8A62C|nr:DUF748 domain-containing protein [Desulfovibrio subterraneus]WBF68946.1 DUF748 domain-containing protein [Desulfovibrio subterraneus]